ncbi:MAG: MFS transporter [Deltaproteobacteria bacterium]|nr:MFS transporter [Deltaproteobacteria bacterium]
MIDRMAEKSIIQRLNLSTIAAAHGFNDGFQVLLVPILPMVMRELKLSNLQTGAIVSVQGIAVFLMLMPSSMFSDYLGRRKPILGFLYDRLRIRELLCFLFVTGFVTTLLVLKTTALPILLILMGLLGIVTFISPIIMTAATLLVDDSVRTSTVGMIYTAYELQFISPLIGGWIADYYSLRCSFLLFASVLLIGGVASLTLKQPSRNAESVA